MAEVAIRRAQSGDVAAIADLYMEIADEVVAREPPLRHVPHHAGVARRYGSRIQDPDRAVFIAVTDGTVIGFVDASLQRHEDRATYDRPGLDAYVEELIVTSAYRRRGVASELMQALEKRAKDARARAILLDTHVTNAHARSLYGALGYREVGVILLKEI